MKSDPELIPEEDFSGMEDYDQTEPDEWTDADDENLDYDFEADRSCSWPCEICGESADDPDEDD